MSYSKKNTKKKIFFVLNTNVMFGAELVNLEIINSLRDKYDFYWVSQSGDVDSFLIDSNIKHIKISSPYSISKLCEKINIFSLYFFTLFKCYDNIISKAR